MDMTVFYAAVAAVEGGHVGEIELIHQTETEGSMTTVTVYVRRDAMKFELGDVA